MSKAVVGGVVVAGVLAVAIGGSWFTGTQVEKSFRALEEEGYAFSSASGNVELEFRSLTYERSLFSAKARTEWAVSLAGKMDDMPVFLDHEIKHGPFPSLKFATVRSTLEMPEAIPAEIRSVLMTALNGRSLIEAETRVGLDGESHQNTLVSPALDLAFPENVQVTWGGMNADWNVKSNGAETSTLSAPLFAVAVPAETVTFRLEGLSATQDLVPLDQYPKLGQGTGSFMIERITAENAEEAFSMAVNGIRMNSEARTDDQFLSAEANLGIEKIIVQNETIENAGFAFRLDRLSLAPLNAIAESLEAVSVDQIDSETQQALMENLTAVLKQQPVMEIKRIGFKANEGELNMSTRVAYTGSGDLSRPPVAADIDADVRMAVAKPLLERILAGTVGTRHAAMVLFEEEHEEGEPDMEKLARDFAVNVVSQFEQAGLIKADADKLTLSFQNSKGQMMLNEKPVTPAELGAMAMGVQQALQSH